MFTIITNKVYVIENNKIFPVNVSKEKGVEKVGQGKDLPKTYDIYTIQEIFAKFNVKENKPYLFEPQKGQSKPNGTNVGNNKTDNQ